MDFRLLNKETLPQAMELWDYCFEKKDTPFFKWYFSEYCLKQNKILGGFKDGRLATMLHLNPYTLMLRGKTYLVPYIVGVATDPVDRGQHVMGDLMKTAFTMLRAMRVPFVILMPIFAGIYQPYGFRYTHFRRQYEMPLSALSFGAVEDSEYQLERIPTLSAKSLIAPVYERAVARYNGYVVRDDRAWDNLLITSDQDNMETVIVKDGSDILGYMLYNKENEVVNVQELMSVSAPAMYRLMSYLRGLAGTYKTLCYLAPCDDLTYLRLPDQSMAPKIAPFMMGRIIDAALFLEGLAIPQALLHDTLTLAIRDEDIPLNTMLVKVSFTDGGIKLLNTLEDPDVLLDIGAFTQLAFGAVSVDDLRHAGFILTRDEEAARKLTLLFPAQHNYINEYF